MSDDDKREYFRVDDTLPVAYSAVFESEGAVGTATAEKSEREAGISDKELAVLLLSINEKLDHILKQLEQGIPGSPPLKEVNISAGGIRFKTREQFKKGDIIKITVGLPPQPFKIINFLGEVVRVQRGPELGSFFETAVKFIDVQEEHRNEILRHLFRVQRNQKLSSEPE